jgi:hypothetical protein
VAPVVALLPSGPSWVLACETGREAPAARSYATLIMLPMLQARRSAFTR